ncbi:MAG TPA: hypothetical protein VI248_08280 [Kineosporiaceae bacterium]
MTTGRSWVPRDTGIQALILLVALGVFSWGVNVPSVWRDETVTLGMGRRSVPDIVKAVHNHDLVHGLYYLLAHVVMVAVSGLTSDLLAAGRAMAVVAMAAAAVVLFRLGRELAGRGTGVLAAAVFIGSPLISRYAQEARSYAFVVLGATTATHLLVLATHRTISPGAGGKVYGRRTWPTWLAYGVVLVATAITNLMVSTLLVAHLVYVLAFARPALKLWTGIVTVSLVPIGGFAYEASLQSDQIAWIKRPTTADLQEFFLSEFATWWVFVLIAVIFVAGLALRTLSGDPGGTDVAPAYGHPERAVEAVVLGVAWCVLPVLTLWSASFVHPIWVPRYALFTTPGTTLAAAGAVALLRRPSRPAAAPDGDPRPGALRWVHVAASGLMVAAVVLLGIPAQAQVRGPVGHHEDLRGALDYLTTHSRTGDSILFMPAYLRQTQVALPEIFVGLRDPLLGEEAVASGDISGHDVPKEQFAARLRVSPRIWVLSGPPDQAANGPDAVKMAVLTQDYRAVSAVHLTWWNATLYVRKGTVRKGTPTGAPPANR